MFLILPEEKRTCLQGFILAASILGPVPIQESSYSSSMRWVYLTGLYNRSLLVFITPSCTIFACYLGTQNNCVSKWTFQILSAYVSHLMKGFSSSTAGTFMIYSVDLCAYTNPNNAQTRENQIIFWFSISCLLLYLPSYRLCVQFNKNWCRALIIVKIPSHNKVCRRPQQSKPGWATSFPFRPKHDKLGTCTWTKTVKKMTVMMAVRNISLRGKSSFFNRKPREKAMAPRRPP